MIQEICIMAFMACKMSLKIGEFAFYLWYPFTL